EVVGIATDARVTHVDRTPPLMVYIPYWWQSRTTMALLVKSSVDASAVMPSIRRVVQEIDPEIAIGESRSLDRLVDEALAGRRYQTELLVVFGAAALLIATIGVYAVTAYGVALRRREMNLRVALGAEASQVVGMVVWQGSLPVVLGA